MKPYKISIIGLGYVGLPLAVEFAKYYPVVGFDIDKSRVNELNEGRDSTLEVSAEELRQVRDGLKCSSDIADAREANVYIVTIPTPVDKNNKPNLTPLIKATQTVAGVLSKGDLVVYESTVYPGATEEECIPVLEEVSGLQLNKDFFCGYSPERINPGDKEHTVAKIMKVTSGSTPEAAEEIDQLYKTVIGAGTYKAANIKAAEAAKVIENAQRDINIAFINELAMIFNRLGIDTMDVLEAAQTKWNFLPFRPGLVGGHCIGVDPYYLAQKAEEAGYHPEIILAGRRLNNSMGSYIAKEFVKMLIKNGTKVCGARVLILGITFKENCPDIRNSRVIDIIRELEDFGVEVDVYDPRADRQAVRKAYGIALKPTLGFDGCQGLLLAVSHDEFRSSKSLAEQNIPIYDVKSCLDRASITCRL